MSDKESKDLLVFAIGGIVIMLAGAIAFWFMTRNENANRQIRLNDAGVEKRDVPLDRTDPTTEKSGRAEGSSPEISREPMRFALPPDSIDSKTRKRMLANIIAKLTQSARPGNESNASAETSRANPAQPLGKLSPEYIEQSVKQIRPLLEECYSLALEKQPDLQGRIKVRFTILADEEYGGLIESADVLEGELAGNNLLAECFTQTMYALKMKAPEGGGRVTVTYPFTLSRQKPRRP